MSDAASRLDIEIALKQVQDGQPVVAQQIEALQKAAADLGPAGQQAFDALDKIGKTTAINDAANDLRQAALEAGKLAEALTNTGAGLAQSPANAMVYSTAGVTDEQIEGMVALEAAIDRQIGKKKALGEATVAEELALEKVTAALAPYREQLDQLQYNLQQILSVRAQIANAEKDKPPDGAFMQEAIQQSQQLAAARRAEMEAGQQAAISVSAQAKGKKELADRTKEVKDEEARRKEVLAEAIRANVDDTKETEKGSKAKVEYKDALKGLALEIPHVGQALRLITSPIALVGAAAGAGIAEVMRLLDHLDALETRANAFGTRNTRVDPFSVIEERGGQDRDTARERLAQYALGLSEVSRQLHEMTTQLAIQQNLTSKGAQVQLAADLESIEVKLARGEITLAEAIRQRADAQSTARKESEAAVLEGIAKQAAIEELTASRARNKSREAAAAAEGMQPEIDSQIDVTNKAQTDVGDISAFNEEKRKNLEDQKRFFMDAVSSPQMAKLDWPRYFKIRLQSGMTSPHAPRNPMASDDEVRKWAEGGLSQAQEEINKLNTEVASAKKLAAKEERRLAQLKAKQAAKDAEALTNEQTSDAAEQRGKDMRARHDAESKASAENAPKIEATEKSRTQRAVDEANEKAQREIDKQEEEWNAYIIKAREAQAGGRKPPPPPNFAVPVGAAPAPERHAAAPPVFEAASEQERQRARELRAKKEATPEFKQRQATAQANRDKWAAEDTASKQAQAEGRAALQQRDDPERAQRATERAARQERWAQEDAAEKAKQEAARRERDERDAIEKARRANRGGDRGDAGAINVQPVASAIDGNTGALAELGKAVIGGLSAQNQVIAQIRNELEAIKGEARTNLMTL